jgi:hypothetical protein
MISVLVVGLLTLLLLLGLKVWSVTLERDEAREERASMLRWWKSGNEQYEDDLRDQRERHRAHVQSLVVDIVNLQQRVDLFWGVMCDQASRLTVQYDNIGVLQGRLKRQDEFIRGLFATIKGYRNTITEHSCKNVKAYTGQRPPKCGGGKGCIGCSMKRAHYVATHPAPAK